MSNDDILAYSTWDAGSKRDQETRDDAILSALLHSPGTSGQEIADVLGVYVQTVREGIQRLVKAGKLVQVGEAYCPPGMAPSHDHGEPGLDPVERRKRIIEWVQKEPLPPTLAEMAKAFGVTRATINKDIGYLTNPLFGAPLRRAENAGKSRVLQVAYVADWRDPLLHQKNRRQRD